MNTNKPCAEIIESSLQSWLAQSWQWNHFIPFGSLVTVECDNLTLFGLVFQIQTGSMDPTRYPFPYQKTTQELLNEQPQIFAFLKTTFSCITAGYAQQDNISYLLPPHPPHIHAFVTSASEDAYRTFFSGEQYLHLLFTLSSVGGFNIDELLLSIFKHLMQLGLLPHDRLTSLMHVYLLLTNNDYRRMKLFLQRLERMR